MPQGRHRHRRRLGCKGIRSDRPVAYAWFASCGSSPAPASPTPTPPRVEPSGYRDRQWPVRRGRQHDCCLRVVGRLRRAAFSSAASTRRPGKHAPARRNTPRSRRDNTLSRCEQANTSGRKRPTPAEAAWTVDTIVPVVTLVTSRQRVCDEPQHPDLLGLRRHRTAGLIDSDGQGLLGLDGVGVAGADAHHDGAWRAVVARGIQRAPGRHLHGAGEPERRSREAPARVPQTPSP